MQSTKANETQNTEENSAKKKRGAEKEIRKEDVKGEDEEDEDEDEDVQKQGTWQRADEATLAQRKKVKVRGRGNSTLEPENVQAPPPLFPTFNFSLPITPSSEKNGKDKSSEETKKEEYKSPFAQLNFPTPSWLTNPTTSSSTTPSFTFSTSFSFSSSPSSFSTTTSIFGLNIAPPIATSSAPSFESNSPSSSPTSSPERESPTSEKTESKLPSEPIKTGEEEEQHVFQTRAKLFVLDTKDNKWHERGVGQFKVNASKDGSSSRLVMRVEGIGRLILNIPIYATMKIEKSGDKAVRFIGASMDKDKEKEMNIYSLRVATKDIVDQMIDAVEKQKRPTTLHTNGEQKEHHTTPTKQEEHQ